MILKKIGMITIGQSPRIDIVPEMREVLGADVEILEAGALDGLTLEEVKKILPEERRLHSLHSNVRWDRGRGCKEVYPSPSS